MQSAGPLDDYMDRLLANQVTGPWGWSTQDVPAILERWSSTLDPGNVHVVTVPPRGAPRNLLWRRWCQVLEISPQSCDLDVAFGNESMGAAQAAFLLKVKPHLPAELRPAPERHAWVRGHLGHEVLVPQQGVRFGLRLHHLEQLRLRALKDSKVLAARAYDVVGDLDELIPEQPQAEPPTQPT